MNYSIKNLFNRNTLIYSVNECSLIRVSYKLALKVLENEFVKVSIVISLRRSRNYVDSERR